MTGTKSNVKRDCAGKTIASLYTAQQVTSKQGTMNAIVSGPERLGIAKEINTE
jgi:hypothetical protein